MRWNRFQRRLQQCFQFTIYNGSKTCESCPRGSLHYSEKTKQNIILNGLENLQYDETYRAIFPNNNAMHCMHHRHKEVLVNCQKTNRRLRCKMQMKMPHKMLDTIASTWLQNSLYTTIEQVPEAASTMFPIYNDGSKDMRILPKRITTWHYSKKIYNYTKWTSESPILRRIAQFANNNTMHHGVCGTDTRRKEVMRLNKLQFEYRYCFELWQLIHIEYGSSGEPPLYQFDATRIEKPACLFFMYAASSMDEPSLL